MKPNVYLTSNVFLEISNNEKISKNIRNTIKKLWDKLSTISNLNYFDDRFPDEAQLRKDLENYDPEIIGCHLSHPISKDLLKKSKIFAIATSTAGYNHVQRTEKDNVLITHTPGVLHQTVADYTVALIIANLRNLIDLHNYFWNEKWTSEDKWDLDQSLSSVINNKTIGIVGLGEIGVELLKRLDPWGLKIQYFDINRRKDIEKTYPDLEYKEDIKDIFKEADVISLHIPLNQHTEKLINRDLLKLMKKNALLVNTARGGIIDLEALLTLLENREIEINISFDVYPQEPIGFKSLERFKKIKAEQPNIRMVLMPHNASADADTRGKMVCLFLDNIIKIIESSKIDDLKDVYIIPEQKKKLTSHEWKIYNYWDKKVGE